MRRNTPDGPELTQMKGDEGKMGRMGEEGDEEMDMDRSTVLLTRKADALLGTKYCATGNHRVPAEHGRPKRRGRVRGFECFDCAARRAMHQAGAAPKIEGETVTGRRT